MWQQSGGERRRWGFAHCDICACAIRLERFIRRDIARGDL
jgi:hypothetical protein